MAFTNEQLKNLANESLKYFQSAEGMSNNKEFWKECQDISKEWIDLLDQPSLSIESIRSFTEKLEKLNNKNSSHCLIHLTQVVNDWVTNLSLLR